MTENIAKIRAEAIREFARSIDLDEMVRLWGGELMGDTGDGPWSAANSAAQVQINAFDMADRIERASADDTKWYIHESVHQQLLKNIQKTVDVLGPESTMPDGAPDEILRNALDTIMAMWIELRRAGILVA